jgi:hypothetical protein
MLTTIVLTNTEACITYILAAVGTWHVFVRPLATSMLKKDI